MALTAATATSPASVSLGLCRSIRIARLRSVSISTTAALAPRRRGAASFFAGFLGTFLHQSRLVLTLVLKLILSLILRLILRFLAQHRHQRGDLALGRLDLRRRVDERQLDGDGGALAEPALYRQFAEMQCHQTVHDRKTEAGAFVAALIGLACLEERRADTLE